MTAGSEGANLFKSAGAKPVVLVTRACASAVDSALVAMAHLLRVTCNHDRNRIDRAAILSRRAGATDDYGRSRISHSRSVRALSIVGALTLKRLSS